MKTMNRKFVALLVVLPLATGTALADPNRSDEDNPIFIIGGKPVHANVGVQSDQTEVIYTVPNGKRLHIQFVSFTGTKKSGQTVAEVSIRTMLESTSVAHYLAEVFDFDTSGGFVYSQSVNLYAGPNTNVELRAVGNLGELLEAWRGTIAGRLESVPD